MLKASVSAVLAFLIFLVMHFAYFHYFFPEEKIIVSILREKNTVNIDEINLKSGLSSSAVAAAILNLELQTVVLSLPGKMYQLA